MAGSPVCWRAEESLDRDAGLEWSCAGSWRAGEPGGLDKLGRRAGARWTTHKSQTPFALEDSLTALTAGRWRCLSRAGRPSLQALYAMFGQALVHGHLLGYQLGAYRGTSLAYGRT